MVESGRVPGKGRIRASIEKLSWRVPRKVRINASTEKLCRRVPEKGRISVSTEKWYNPTEYREKVESLRVSKNCPSCTEKVRIRVRFEKLSRRVPKMGRISFGTEKW